MFSAWLNSPENCCLLVLILKIKRNGSYTWRVLFSEFYGISKAKSLNKADETLSGVFISVFSRKVLLRK